MGGGINQGLLSLPEHFRNRLLCRRPVFNLPSMCFSCTPPIPAVGAEPSQANVLNSSPILLFGGWKRSRHKGIRNGKNHYRKKYIFLPVFFGRICCMIPGFEYDLNCILMETRKRRERHAQTDRIQEYRQEF